MSYLENFEKQCHLFFYNYQHNKPKYEEFKQAVTVWHPFEPIDTKYNPYYFQIGCLIDLLIKDIANQMFWYIEAVEQYPNDKEKQFKHLYEYIEHRTFKFREYQRSIDSELTELTYNDSETANKIFNDILYITNNLIDFWEYNYSFSFVFEFTQTPLFVLLMEFVQSINKRAGNIAHLFPKVEAYFENIDSLKKLYEIEPNQEKEQKGNESQTPADKIAEILETLRRAFDTKGDKEKGIPGQIDIIIEGFISFRTGKQFRKQKEIVRMDMKEFIKPFRKLQVEKLFKQEEICTLLLYFIEKNVSTDPNYSPNYLRRLLSNSNK